MTIPNSFQGLPLDPEQPYEPDPETYARATDGAEAWAAPEASTSRASTPPPTSRASTASTRTRA